MKKSNTRVEELERALEIERSKNDSIKSTFGLGMGQSTAESQEPHIVQLQQKSDTKVVIRVDTAAGIAPKEAAVEDSSFGDVSSIMIQPDQHYNNFNLMDDEEEEPDLKQVQVPAGKKGVNNRS